MAVLVAQSQGHITKGTLLTKIGSFRSKREYGTNVRERALIHLTWLIISKLIAFFKKRDPLLCRKVPIYTELLNQEVFLGVYSTCSSSNSIRVSGYHQNATLVLRDVSKNIIARANAKKNLIRTLKRNAQLTILIERSPNSYLTCFFVCANNV